MKPIVAIVGRPNVGKSRLFNRLLQQSRAIVHDQPGLTRDRHYGEAEWEGVPFTIVDTGGIVPETTDRMDQSVTLQSLYAVREADVILCLLDGKEGLHPVDKIIIEILRKQKKPVVYVVNKVDHAAEENILFDFSSTGIKPLFSISAEHGRKVGDLLAIMLPLIKEAAEKTPQTEDGKHPTIALIGRPNVGKSTLTNTLAGSERSVVHEVAGTTRDAIDVLIERNGETYLFVDTAGIKRKRQANTDVEAWAALRSMKAVERAKIVLALIDGAEGLTHQDLQLIHTAWDQHKPVLLLVNKWDLVKKEWKEYQTWCDEKLGSLAGLPKLAISAKTGFKCEKIWREIRNIVVGMNQTVATSALNRWLEEVQIKHAPPAPQGRPVKFFYATQTEKTPPHFLLFTNQPKDVQKSYQQYLKQQLRELLKIPMIPVIISFKEKK